MVAQPLGTLLSVDEVARLTYVFEIERRSTL
jgi:hypothetical protein